MTGVPGWVETLLLAALIGLSAASAAYAAEREHGAVAWEDPGGWRLPKAETAGLRAAILAGTVAAGFGILLAVA